MPTKQNPAALREAIDNDYLPDEAVVERSAHEEEPTAETQDTDTDGYGPPRAKKGNGAMPVHKPGK